MKIYSYVLRSDSGFAPNPFWDYCTLACDQALIRQVANVNDWIVGLKESSKKIADHRLIFAMQVIEKITLEKYWDDYRFQVKKPVISSDKEIFRVGDNIYEKIANDFTQHNSKHSREYFTSDSEWLHQKQEDIQGKFVLIADNDHFFYFGSEPVAFPSLELADLLYCDIGNKCIADPNVPKEFLDFINVLKENGKKGFIYPPEIWSIKDDSWKQCITKE
ncbi:MAG: hypothetical protein JXA54_01570 [Candidatus Heimdallarchaeota archaeon]|nr:hypothetical protein [Candidatus Heimdallarchaeota archaeon]